MRASLNIVLLTAIAVVACTGCGADPVIYGRGFFNAEPAEDGSLYRWMGDEGVVQFKNVHRDMVLTVDCTVPLDNLGRAPVLRFELNGQVLARFTAAEDDIVRHFDVPVAGQGTGDLSELKIQTTETFVPHDRDTSSSDVRHLGLIVRSISWAPK